MRTGLRTCTSTSFLTEDSMVAEKNMVWRAAGMTDMIRLMEGRNAMSKGIPLKYHLPIRVVQSACESMRFTFGYVPAGHHGPPLPTSGGGPTAVGSRLVRWEEPECGGTIARDR